MIVKKYDNSKNSDNYNNYETVLLISMIIIKVIGEGTHKKTMEVDIGLHSNLHMHECQSTTLNNKNNHNNDNNDDDDAAADDDNDECSRCDVLCCSILSHKF